MADCHLFSYRVSENIPAVDEMIARITQAVLLHVFKLDSPIGIASDQEISHATRLSIDLDRTWMFGDLDNDTKQNVLRLCLPIITQIVWSASSRVNWRTYAAEDAAWKTLTIPCYLHAHAHRRVRQLSTQYTHGVGVTLYSNSGDLVLDQCLGANLMAPHHGEVVTGQLADIQTRARDRKVAIVTPRTGKDRVLLLAHSIDPTPAIGSLIHAITVPTRGRIFNRMIGWTNTQGSLFAEPLPIPRERHCGEIPVVP